jgi:hypothetical protein
MSFGLPGLSTSLSLCRDAQCLFGKFVHSSKSVARTPPAVWMQLSPLNFEGQMLAVANRVFAIIFLFVTAIQWFEIVRTFGL